MVQLKLMRTGFAYEVLESELRANISNGSLVSGTKIGSETTLAENYGISRGSVRTALDNLLREGLIYKVKGSGTIVADNVASKASKQILFLTFATTQSREAFFERGTYRPMVDGMTKICEQCGYNLLISFVDLDWQAPNCLVNHDIDGVIFHGDVDLVFFEKWIAPLPNLSLLYDHPEHDGFSLKEDSLSWGLQAVQAFKDANRKRIGFVCDEIDRPMFLDRYCGFRWAMKKLGVVFHEELMALWQRPLVDGILPVERNMPDFRPQLCRMFDGSIEPPDALICVDDWRALDTIEALKLLNVNVPEDVSVIGAHYQGSTRAPFTKFISSLDVSLDDSCANAVRFLKQLIDNNINREINILVRPKYIKGQTIIKKQEKIG